MHKEITTEENPFLHFLRLFRAVVSYYKNNVHVPIMTKGRENMRVEDIIVPWLAGVVEY